MAHQRADPGASGGPNYPVHRVYTRKQERTVRKGPTIAHHITAHPTMHQHTGDPMTTSGHFTTDLVHGLPPVRGIRVDNNGVSLAVRRWEGAGPPLLLIHGISSSERGFEPIIPQLAKHFSPITYDLRGHGESDKPDHGYLYDEYISDLDAILTALDLERPLILGHSLGGLITLWWAARYPDRAAAMVIEDSPLRSGHDFAEAFDGWIHLNGLPLEELTAHYRSENPTWSSEAAHLRAAQMHVAAPNVFHELRADSVANEGVDRIAEIAGIASPTLLIHGDAETGSMVHPEDPPRIASLLARGETTRIPDGSHNLHIQKPAEFLSAAVPFLAKHASTESR